MITEYRRYIIRSTRLPEPGNTIDGDETFFCNDDCDWSTMPQNATRFTHNQAMSKLFELFDTYEANNQVLHVIELHTTLKEVSVSTNIIDR